VLISALAHLMVVSWRTFERRPEIKYVNGDKWYIQCQNPTSWLTGWRTPLKMMTKEKRSVTNVAAVCSFGARAASACPNELQKRVKRMYMYHIYAPRESTPDGKER